MELPIWRSGPEDSHRLMGSALELDSLLHIPVRSGAAGIHFQKDIVAGHLPFRKK